MMQSPCRWCECRRRRPQRSADKERKTGLAAAPRGPEATLAVAALRVATLAIATLAIAALSVPALSVATLAVAGQAGAGAAAVTWLSGAARIDRC